MHPGFYSVVVQGACPKESLPLWLSRPRSHEGPGAFLTIDACRVGPARVFMNHTHRGRHATRRRDEKWGFVATNVAERHTRKPAAHRMLTAGVTARPRRNHDAGAAPRSPARTIAMALAANPLPTTDP